MVWDKKVTSLPLQHQARNQLPMGQNLPGAPEASAVLSGYIVQRSGFRVPGFGFRVRGPAEQEVVSGFMFWGLGFGFRVSGIYVPGFGIRLRSQSLRRPVRV